MTTEHNKAIAHEFFARFTASDIDGALNTMTDDAVHQRQDCTSVQSHGESP